MSPFFQRKYIDLIRRVSSRWVNWDPPIGVRVGSYGTINKETGDLIVEGNIYDSDFQWELEKHGVKIDLADHPPQEGPIEGDFVIASRGARRQEVNVDIETDARDFANATIKGQWLFERGKRDAILIMHCPRQIFLPRNVVLEPLYQVDKLIDKHLVTSTHVCPAYSMYLSDKSGDKISLALVSKAPISGVSTITAGVNTGLTWQAGSQAGFLRMASDQTGSYKFTPLYSLRRPIKRYRRLFRDRIQPEPAGDDLWYNDSPPWDPLDEDGVEDPFNPAILETDPFAHVTPPGKELDEKVTFTPTSIRHV